MAGTGRKPPVGLRLLTTRCGRRRNARCWLLMPLEPLWKGSELLHKLLSDYLTGSLDTALFCDNFETAFNFDVNRHELTPTEETVFGQLFDQVIYYSPFPQERAQIPNYRSEEQIIQAAREADGLLREAG